MSHQTIPHRLKTTKIGGKIGEIMGEKIGNYFPGSRSIVNDLGVNEYLIEIFNRKMIIRL